MLYFIYTQRCQSKVTTYAVVKIISLHFTIITLLFYKSYQAGFKSYLS